MVEIDVERFGCVYALCKDSFWLSFPTIICQFPDID